MKVIASAPMRISLLGGGTDLPVFSDKFGGICVSMAIDLRRRVEIEEAETTSFEEQQNGDSNFVQAFLDSFGVKNVTVRTFTDVPLRSGLGASASIGVSLVAALALYKNRKMSKEEIAERAWDIEVNKLNLYGGKQDQYAAAFGGLRAYRFSPTGVEVMGFPFPTREFWGERVLLFNTGLVRTDPKIQEGLKTLTEKQENHLASISTIAKEAVGDIYLHEYENLVELMNDSWEQKKKTNKVSNEKIDLIYEFALESGADAGKLLGSGGGGHMAFLVKPENKERLISKLAKFKINNVNFLPDNDGVNAKIMP